MQVSPTMCAEELTNQVLYMRNVPAGDKDVWMTFEAIEDGQLGEQTLLSLSGGQRSPVSHVGCCHVSRASVTPQREGPGASSAVV